MHWWDVSDGADVDRCYPPYISPKAHAKLSRADAFSGLRIHTDEINEVIARIKSATLTIAVVRFLLALSFFLSCQVLHGKTLTESIIPDNGLNGLVQPQHRRGRRSSRGFKPRLETRRTSPTALGGAKTMVYIRVRETGIFHPASCSSDSGKLY